MTAPTVADVFDLAGPASRTVVEARLTLCAAAVDAPLDLGSYTDEELVGLDGPGGTPSAPSPWYSSLSEAEQRTALTAALRGLTARGAYRAEPVDEATGAFVFRALPDVLALLTMRRHTDRVVVAERRGAARCDWAVLYQQRAGLWLVERVDHVGVHEFVLCTAEEAARALTAWSGAHGELPVPELDVLLDREQVAAGPQELEPVHRCTLAVTLTRLRVGDPGAEESSGVFTGPGGCFVSTAAPGGGVVYRGASPETVLAHWRDALGAS
ncbi:hypothetical protein [Kineococcus sp. G2]|uniref:hypothetical protein n=1 Tax=Kineococcus sp. G2 TaxID=3127484 RepID=UPI00301BD66A